MTQPLEAPRLLISFVCSPSHPTQEFAALGTLGAYIHSTPGPMTAGSALGPAPRAAMQQLRLHQASVEKAVLTRLALRLGISLQVGGPGRNGMIFVSPSLKQL